MTTPVLRYTSAGAGVHVDVARLITTRMLIQASSGGGKSRALRQLLEETHGKVQQFVIDPEGEFATLREKFDFVLAAKTGGDVLASPKTAKLLCRRLVELGSSAVLDLYELPLAERREFVKIFLTELMALPKTLWHPILVVIDEAHVFCPEKGSGESQSSAAVIDLCTQGRKRGFCAVLATQRISKLMKDAAAELGNKMIGRTGLDVDQKRAGDELGFDKERRLELRTLADGEFFAYGPAISQAVTKIRTGEIKTTHPQAGQIGAPAPAAPAKVKAVLAQLVDLPKEAEQEARSIAELKTENAALKSNVRRLEKDGVKQIIEKPIVDQGAIDRAVKLAQRDQSAVIAKLRQGLEDAMKFIVNIETANFDVAGVSKEELEKAILAAVEKANGLIESRLAVRARELGELRKAAGRILQRIGSLADAEGQPVVVDVKATKNAPFTVSSPRAIVPPRPPSVPRNERIVSESGASDDLKPAERKIINGLAVFERLGLSPVARVSAAFFAGYTENGHFNNMVGRLRSIGIVDYPSGNMLALTDEGRALADADAHPINSLVDLHELWRSKLSPSEGKLLVALISRYPEPMTRAELAEATGYTENGHFNNMVGHLRSLAAARYPSGNMVVADAVLFPEGLA